MPRLLRPRPQQRSGSKVNRPRRLEVLVDAREELVTARTAEANRLHADLSILLPGYTGQLRSLVHPNSVTTAAELLDASDVVRAGSARRRIVRLRRSATRLPT
jgi:hypothetical protein